MRPTIGSMLTPWFDITGTTTMGSQFVNRQLTMMWPSRQKPNQGVHSLCVDIYILIVLFAL